MIIEAGRAQPKENASVGLANKEGGIVDTKTRTSHISWIPFSKMPEMYKDIETMMKKTNGNHFGFDGMQLICEVLVSVSTIPPSLLAKPTLAPCLG